MDARSTQGETPLNLGAPALYEQVAKHLRDRIFAHQLAPGAWVDEQAIATEFGISRTPLREALKVLASEGLVELRPRRGCYVAQLSEQDLDQIFPVMALLESFAIREATSRIDEAGQKRLADIHQELERYAAAQDPDRFFDANQRFHSAIQELSANRWLCQLIDETRKFIRLTRRNSLNLDGRLKQSLAEHRDLLAAIERRDAESAARLMHAHILSGRAALAKLHIVR